jgi:hypothetical protein
MGMPGLHTNRKFSRLARALTPHCQLGGDIAAAGVLELLWAAAYDAADDRIGDATDIENAVRWTGPRGILVRALLDAGGEGKDGFIEEDQEAAGHYLVHDFWEHCPKFVRDRAKRNEKRAEEGKSLSQVRAEAGRKGATITNRPKRRQVNGQLPLLGLLGSAGFADAAEQPRASARGATLGPGAVLGSEPPRAVGEVQGADPGMPRAVEAVSLGAVPGSMPGAVPVQSSKPDAVPVQPQTPGAVPARAVPSAQEVPDAALGKAPRAVEGKPGAVLGEVEDLRRLVERTREAPASVQLAEHIWPKTEQVRRLVSQGLGGQQNGGRGLRSIESVADRDLFERDVGAVGVERAAAACIEHAIEQGKGAGLRSLAYFREFVSELASPATPHAAAAGPPRNGARRRTMAPVSNWDDPAKATETL